MIGPRHIPYGDWIQHCYNDLARRSLNSGITLAEACEGVAFANRVKSAIENPNSAEVIPFPVRHGA